MENFTKLFSLKNYKEYMLIDITQLTGITSAINSAVSAGAQDLASVLAIGNSTGANDITMSTLTGTRLIRTDNETSSKQVAIQFYAPSVKGSIYDSIAIGDPTFTNGGYLGAYGEAVELGVLNVNVFAGIIIESSSSTMKFIAPTADPYDIQFLSEVNVLMQSPDDANFFADFTPANLTADRTYTFQDASGTVALTSDITGTNSGTNTGDQTITLTGDVTGSGTGSFATTIAVDAVDIAMLSATGTADATTFLRGDNTWSVPGGTGDVSKVGTPVNNQLGIWTGNGTIEGDPNFVWSGTTATLSGGTSNTISLNPASGGYSQSFDGYSQITSTSASASLYPITRMTRYMGSLIAPTAVTNGSVMGQLSWSSSGGDSAMITVSASENHIPASNEGSVMYIKHTVTGTATPVNRITLDGSGTVTFNNAGASFTLPNARGTAGQALVDTVGNGVLAWVDLTESMITDLGSYLPLTGGTITGQVLNTDILAHTSTTLAIPVTHRRVNLTRTGVTANTLANGVTGQKITIVSTSGTGTATITPSSLLGYSTITFNDIGDTVTLEYGTGGWAIISVFNAVVA